MSPVRSTFVGLCFAALAGPALGQDPAREVVGVLTSFFDAMRAKDSSSMAARLDSTSRFTLLRPAPAGGSRVAVLDAAGFIRAVTNPTGPAVDERIRNPVVQVDGDLATVWTEYQVVINGALSHCGFDAFHLARLGGEWKILNVSDTFRREGCGELWPTGR